MADSDQSTDVLIVGGGPAGLAAAIAVSNKGLRVTVADGSAPPIDKPCGEGMLPETLAALAQLGVCFSPQEGFPFRGITFAQDGSRASADFPHGRALGLRRPILHERLVARAEECGVRFLWRTVVTGVAGDSVRLAHGVIRSQWVVGADGHGSRVRRWSGLDSTVRHRQRYACWRHYRVRPWSQTMEIYWGSRSQAYATPIADDEVCVVITAETAEEAAFARALGEMPELREKLAKAELSSRERGAVTGMRSLRNVQHGNIALLGDASGGVDAITGEGLRLAFQQAFALSDALAAGDLRQYQRTHRKIVWRPTLMGNLMLMLSRHPQLRSRMIRAMERRPRLLARMLAIHVGQATAVDLLSTGAQLGLQLLGAAEKG